MIKYTEHQFYKEPYYMRTPQPPMQQWHLPENPYTDYNTTSDMLIITCKRNYLMFSSFSLIPKS
jgi:hypothetical protein